MASFHIDRTFAYLHHNQKLPKDHDSRKEIKTLYSPSLSKLSPSEPTSFFDVMVQRVIMEKTKIKRTAPSGIRTRVSRLGSVNANHYTNGASPKSSSLCIRKPWTDFPSLILNLSPWAVVPKLKERDKQERVIGIPDVCAL